MIGWELLGLGKIGTAKGFAVLCQTQRKLIVTNNPTKRWTIHLGKLFYFFTHT